MPARSEQTQQAGSPYREAMADWFRWPPFRALLGVLLAQGAAHGWCAYGYDWIGRRYQLPFWIDELTVWLTLPLSLVSSLLVVSFPALMVWRIRSHLTDWRSALTPEFRRVNFLTGMALCAALFAVAVIGPALLDYAAHYVLLPASEQLPHASQMFSEISRTLLAMSVAGFVASVASPWLVLPMAFGLWGLPWLANLADEGTVTWNFFHVLTSAYFDGFTGACRWLGLDVCMLLLLWLRVNRLSPATEMGQGRYGISVSDALGGFRSLAPGEFFRGGLIKRVAHRRIIGIGRLFALLLAAYLSLLMTLSALFNRLTMNYSGWITDRGYAYAALVIAAITPGILVGLLWPWRLGRLGAVEMLRPDSREGFIGEIGLAMMCDMAEIAIATIATSIVPIAVWSPYGLLDAGLWMGYAAAGLSQVLAFGLVVAAMRRRSFAVSVAGQAVAMIVTAIVINLAMDQGRILPAVLAAGFGVMVIGGAYRVWLRAEIA